VAHFSAVTAAVPGTELVATVPRRLAEIQAADPRLRLVEAPEEFDAVAYGMIWHPRLETDPAHCWLRDMIRGRGAGGSALTV
jgi:DNA-binding transcriptional LysR family regulator